VRTLRAPFLLGDSSVLLRSPFHYLDYALEEGVIRITEKGYGAKFPELKSEPVSSLHTEARAMRGDQLWRLPKQIGAGKYGLTTAESAGCR